MENCTGSTLSKYNTGLTHMAHCTGSGANTIQDSHTQHTALAVVQTQHRSYTTVHNLLTQPPILAVYKTHTIQYKNA